MIVAMVVTIAAFMRNFLSLLLQRLDKGVSFMDLCGVDIGSNGFVSSHRSGSQFTVG